jgi:ribose transport system permease protein
VNTQTTAPPQTAPPAEAGTAGTGRRQHVTFRVYWQTLGPATIFLAVFLLIALLNPNFIPGGGMGIVATIAAPILMVALGQAMVLNVGSIDLSNAAMGLLGAILLALMLPRLGVASPVLILAITTLLGAVNGLFVAYTKVPSFALTLGTLGVFTSAALVFSNATAVYVPNNSAFIGQLHTTRLAGAPMSFVIGVVVAVLLWLLLRFTTVGRGMTAIGLNERGAIFSGLRNARLKVLAFALSGLMSGLAAITIIGQAGSASPNGLGSDLLLPGIAAAIVGGTSILGGSTNPINVVFGALTVSLIPIANAVIGVNAQAQSLVYGLAIIVIAALMMSGSRKGIVK